MDYPIKGKSYTLKEIYTELKLDDGPFLMILQKAEYHPIQTSHVKRSQLLANDDIANTIWEYRYTTNEWIPIFYEVVDYNARRLCKIETIDGDVIVSFKAFPYPWYNKV